MPGLAFTRKGDRLGRGKGFYDNYLTQYEKKFGSKPVTVALAFNEQICDFVPTSESDVPVDFVLYEQSDSS